MDEKHLRTAAQQLRDKAQQVQGVIESTKQKLEHTVQSHLREAEQKRAANPDDATYWENQAEKERENAQALIDPMERDVQRYEAEAAEFDAKADQAHKEEEKKEEQLKKELLWRSLPDDKSPNT